MVKDITLLALNAIAFWKICQIKFGNAILLVLIQKNALRHTFFEMVGCQGFEPGTHWLRVSCSTNWANSPFLGAGNEIRTRDFHLGKVTLYHWVIPASALKNISKYYFLCKFFCLERQHINFLPCSKLSL